MTAKATIDPTIDPTTDPTTASIEETIAERERLRAEVSRLSQALVAAPTDAEVAGAERFRAEADRLGKKVAYSDPFKQLREDLGIHPEWHDAIPRCGIEKCSHYTVLADEHGYCGFAGGEAKEPVHLVRLAGTRAQGVCLAAVKDVVTRLQRLTKEPSP